MTKIISLTTSPIRAGKTLALQEAVVEYLKKNPKATLMTVRDGETIIEKHVEPVAPKALQAPLPDGEEERTADK